MTALKTLSFTALAFNSPFGRLDYSQQWLIFTDDGLGFASVGYDYTYSGVGCFCLTVVRLTTSATLKLSESTHFFTVEMFANNPLGASRPMIYLPDGIGLQGQTAVTPLPAALPLFATGLGVLGMLSWRRKRKAVAFRY